MNDTNFSVTVEEGVSEDFTIYLGATGAIKCVATAANPATATVHTLFAVDADGNVTSSTPSAAAAFFGGAALGGPNCSVTWAGAPDPVGRIATATADAATPIGAYPAGCDEDPALGFVIPTARTTPSGSGGNLDDNTKSRLCIHVVAPPAPPDTDPPLVELAFPAPPDGQNGWFNANDVPVIGIVSATDPSGVSGISCTNNGEPVALSDVTGLGTMNASALVSLSTDGTQEVVCTAEDGASPSNSGAAEGSTNTATVHIDTTPPTIIASIDPADPAASGWYNASTGAPTVSFECGDDTSGLAEPCPDSVTLGDGAAQSVSGSVSDNAGNSADATISDIDVDITPPSIVASISPPDPAASGWYNASTGAPTVSFVCDDGTSGLAEPCPDPVTLGDGDGQSVSGSVSDNAGNSADAGFSAIDVDTTPPDVAVTGFSDGAVLDTGDTLPDVGCSVDDPDPGSGIASASGPAVVDGGLNVNGVGSVSYECAATDVAGNDAADVRSYHVHYSGDGPLAILAPINPDNSSVFRRGKAVPVKFRLAGDPLPDGYYTGEWTIHRIRVSCTDLAEYEAYEDVGSVTPSSFFRYDASADQYIYNADFRVVDPGTCWRVKVSLDDGYTVLYSAYFKVTK